MVFLCFSMVKLPEGTIDIMTPCSIRDEFWPQVGIAILEELLSNPTPEAVVRGERLGLSGSRTGIYYEVVTPQLSMGYKTHENYIYICIYTRFELNLEYAIFQYCRWLGTQINIEYGWISCWFLFPPLVLISKSLYSNSIWISPATPKPRIYVVSRAWLNIQHWYP